MGTMPVRLIPLDSLPAQKRKRNSPIKETSEWRDIIRRIPDLPKGSALAVEFSPGTLALGKATRERFRRLLAAEIRAEQWKGLRLFFRAGVLYCARE